MNDEYEKVQKLTEKMAYLDRDWETLTKQT